MSESRTAMDRWESLSRRLEESALARRLEAVPRAWAVAGGVVLGLFLGAAVLLLLAAGPIASGEVLLALVAAGIVLLTWGARPQITWEEPGPLYPKAGLLRMVEIPGGEFLMGSAEDDPLGFPDEQPQHEVHLSGFQISDAPVTHQELARIMQDDLPPKVELDLPCNGVSWFQACAFCNRLSIAEGLPPCYEIEGEKITWIADRGGYRLPTEAEWEYAARAGTVTPWSFGADEKQLGDFAWYTGNSEDRVHAVRQKKANPWQLYDMHGNVWEWCWDVYAPYDPQADRDPRGPEAAESDAVRVLRGGSAWFGPRNLRSANRIRRRPRVSGVNIGFRCVRRPRPQP